MSSPDDAVNRRKLPEAFAMRLRLTLPAPGSPFRSFVRIRRGGPGAGGWPVQSLRPSGRTGVS